MKEKIILLGCGGHAKSVVDAIESGNKFTIEGFIDNAYQRDFEYRGYRVLGSDDELQEVYDSGVLHAFVCVGFLGQGRVRNKLYERLKEIGYILPVIVDPSAALALDVELGEGTFIGKQAVVNANASVGKMSIINTAAIVEHDCVIGAFSHLAIASVVCGTVQVGKDSFVGANATILQGLEIGDGAIIGAGSIITRNVEGNMKVKNRVVPVFEKIQGGG